MTQKILTPEEETVILDRVRLRRHCTLKALAAEFGVSITTIRRVERAYEARKQAARKEKEREHLMGCTEAGK